MASLPRDKVILLVAMTAGSLVRLIPYLERPSLWLDEARLALNIGARSFAGLLQPLAYDQAAPPLFLWAEKAAVLLGGVNEYALRALPLAAGLLVPVITYALAGRLLRRPEAAVAASLTALSPALVQYSAQVKPYETDALVCVGLLLVFTWESGRAPDRRPGPWTILLGTVAIWFSATTPFALAGILAVSCYWSSRRSGNALAAASVCWGVSFALFYFGAYRPAAANAYLQWFWGDRFLSPWVPGGLGRTFEALREEAFTSFVSDIIELGHSQLAEVVVVAVTLLVVGVAIAGLTRLATTRPEAAVLLSGPPLVAVAASAAGAYPLAARLTLFFVPLLMMLVAAGCTTLMAARVPRVVLGLLLGSIIAAGQLRNLVRAADPFREGHLRPGVAFLEREIRPGDVVYVAANALPAWTFYTTDWSQPDTARLARMAREGSSGGRAFENGPSRRETGMDPYPDLAYPFRSGVELLGVRDGAPFRPGDIWRAPPDSGWARSEAARIQQAAQPQAWLVATTSFGTYRFLDAAVLALGGVRTDAAAEPSILVARYRLPARQSPAERDPGSSTR
jgi:hypothetical protein